MKLANTEQVSYTILTEIFQVNLSLPDLSCIAPSGLPPSRQKKIPDFPDEIADNISNKCSFINRRTKSACYEVSVASQQLTKINSKCWTSGMQKQLWHQSFVTNILPRCHNQISLTTQIHWLFPDFVPFPWPFCKIPRHFQVYVNSRKVVTLAITYYTKIYF